MDSSTYHSWLPSYHPMIFSPRTRNRRSQCSISWEIRLAGCEVAAGAQKWWHMMKPSKFLVKDGDFEWGFQWGFNWWNIADFGQNSYQMWGEHEYTSWSDVNYRGFEAFDYPFRVLNHTTWGVYSRNSAWLMIFSGLSFTLKYILIYIYINIYIYIYMYICIYVYIFSRVNGHEFCVYLILDKHGQTHFWSSGGCRQGWI